jgi:hypothetical protein
MKYQICIDKNMGKSQNIQAIITIDLSIENVIRQTMFVGTHKIIERKKNHQTDERPTSCIYL